MELMPFDIGIERSLRNLRRVRRLEENITRNINQNLNIDDEKIDVLVARKRNLDDY